MTITRTCIVCGKILNSSVPEDIYDDGLENPPGGGIFFHTSGNYGSTVLDSIVDHITVTGYICDECLKERAGSLYVQDDERSYSDTTFMIYLQEKKELYQKLKEEEMTKKAENKITKNISDDVFLELLGKFMNSYYEIAKLKAENDQLAKIVELAKKHMDKEHPAYALLELAE